VIGMPARPQRLTAQRAAPARGEEQGDPSTRTKAARAHATAVLQPTSRWQSAGSVDHYLDEGSGPPLLLLHGKLS
jgi:hypothetical protein